MPRSRSTIRVVTFNIRYGTAPDGPERWSLRKRLVIDRIQQLAPHLLGLQECLDDAQAHFVRRKLPAFSFHGTRRDPAWDLEMAPALIQRDAFDLLRSGHLWLSTTPDVVGSKSWGSAFARTASWIEVRHCATKRSLVFVNTHLDYEPSATARSARVLRTWIEATYPDHPLVVTGDFNASKGSAAYRTLMGAAGGLKDTFRIVHGLGVPEGTYHEYGTVGPLPIDWILVSRHFDVVDATIDTYHEAGRFPSDHYPVAAVLRWQALPGRAR